MALTQADRPEGAAPKAGIFALTMVLAMALVGLMGCAEYGYISNSQRYLSGTKSYVDHVAGTNLPTVIRGNPSALPKADFDQIVRDDMKGSNWGRETTFVAGSDKPPLPGYRMVLIFNGTGFGQYDLCKNTIPAGGGAGPDGRIHLTAAFCSGDRPVTVLAGGINDLKDPNDPRFRRFLRQVGTTLFNPNNPEDNPDRDVNLPVP